MAENAEIERLQPSLLDRLTDHDPTNRKEAREERVIDIRRLREIVMRDLGWLLNTTADKEIADPALYPNVANSVLAFGVDDVTGGFAGIKKANVVRAAIRDAIRRFEPRIRPESIEVTAREDNSAQTIFAFDIVADMWAEPVPLELYLRSEVDVTTGEISVERGV